MVPENLQRVFYKLLAVFALLLLNVDVNSQHALQPIQNNLSMKLGGEYRKTDFRWSIAGNMDGKDPNIYSELIFNPIQAAGFYADANYRLLSKLSIQLHYNQLYTYKGRVTDFDYEGDNRTLPVVQLYLKSHKGTMRTTGGNIHYTAFKNPSWNIETGVGYTATKELFYLLDDQNSDLRSTYTAQWKGPSLIGGVEWYCSKKIYAGVHAALHILKYDAEANWNLIQEFRHPVSFVHDAKGIGWDLKAYMGYKLTRHFEINAEWVYNNWKTNHGTDRLFLANGETPETRMNGAFKKSNGWRAGIIYVF
ncbi:hypothetical protein PIECOFPK_02026 [Mycovorax composti]|jgi:hypothetical protein